MFLSIYSPIYLQALSPFQLSIYPFFHTSFNQDLSLHLSIFIYSFINIHIPINLFICNVHPFNPSTNHLWINPSHLFLKPNNINICINQFISKVYPIYVSYSPHIYLLRENEIKVENMKADVDRIIQREQKLAKGNFKKNINKKRSWI